ncbi:fungal-specific transcription factor domain-containing protein [Xylaria sp. FL0933]|nr:fungal-specific transcription factor domain-containing protein [Xylaria sp. FL0933]
MSLATSLPQADASITTNVSKDITSDSRPRPSASRRRDKPQLSCNNCRRRKSRCDRGQPCSNCLSRNQACTYPLQDFADATTLRQHTPPAALSLRDRLNQLETLVISLRSELVSNETKDQKQSIIQSQLSNDIASSPVAAGAPAGASQYDMHMNESSECGSICISSSKLHYVGGEHWAAILDGIAEIKNQIVSEDEDSYELDETFTERSPRVLLLYGKHKRTSRAEILEALPPKAVADRYVSRYFNRLDLVSCAVHGPSFLREYEAFWESSDAVSLAWLGLLFGILCLAVMASDPQHPSFGSETDHKQLQIELYREKIVDCLIMSEYTKPGPYVLEAVVHYLYVEFLLEPDAQDDLWFLLALEVNMAMRMGYHRDPRHFPEIPPLQAEMRRRLWSTVLLGDILISSQMGMPRMISDRGWDTAEPLNFNDTDLNHDMTQLPSPRPETETTTVLGLISRQRVVMALGAISDLTARAKPSSYAEVIEVDRILRDADARIPPPLKMKPLASSMTDAPILIMSRLFLQHMIYKGQLMLHRRFVQVKTSLHTDDAFAYSRRACLHASLQLLRIQQILDEETQPGGQLDTMRWRMTSIMNHQFLTASMVLCSLVYHDKTQGRFEEVIAALRGARNTWMRVTDSRESQRAAETVNLVLVRASKRDQASVARKDVEGEDGHDDDHADATLLDVDDSNFDLSQFLLHESEPEGLMIRSVFPGIWQTERHQSDNSAFDTSLWDSDYNTLNSRAPAAQPGDTNF